MPATTENCTESLGFESLPFPAVEDMNVMGREVNHLWEKILASRLAIAKCNHPAE